jgi:polyhydroxyalkanoate synthase
VLIVPAWIMKYYVLDLSPDNSLIRTWSATASPSSRSRGRTPLAPIATSAWTTTRSSAFGRAAGGRPHRPRRRHSRHGYCLGGTLLAIAAAALGRDGRSPLRTLSLLAAQTDFTAPGELGLFIDETRSRSSSS